MLKPDPRMRLGLCCDVLVVDEAGQLSLANTLAVSRAAANLVLLGDPQQLRQPGRGIHPDGADVSALQHVLGEQEVLPADRGVFLDRSWRMAPAWSTASPEPHATFEWKPESARSIGSRWSAKRRTFSLASTRWRLRSGSAEKRATLAVALSARHRSELTSCTHGAPVYGQASPASALYSQK